ncbi:hypothetical protein J5N97_014952 [Dioscorea zingiberensis]|uniref:BHLH domain-containing protein n=1 Tax=Dioscorea zingiberensis TaxID=325984 RepID=A0A9D5CW50_9LILI|nr:hypothetical protein J5N97_014952 [Dioscorea zingiberensis]
MLDQLRSDWKCVAVRFLHYVLVKLAFFVISHAKVKIGRGDEKDVLLLKGLLSSSSSVDSGSAVRMREFFEPEGVLICRTSTASPLDHLKLAAMHDTLFHRESQAPSFNSYTMGLLTTTQHGDRFQLSGFSQSSSRTSTAVLTAGFSESKTMLESLIHGHPIATRKHETATKDPNGKHGSKRQKTSHAATGVESPPRRSQKLGDRITTLQQLVSPFGKTDTASVLQETSVCIKVLHEQIKVLISPYFHTKSPACQKKLKEEREDLQSNGLCLVPISTITNLCDHGSLT